MKDAEISFLFANDDLYLIKEAELKEKKINDDLLLLVRANGKKENCEEIINRLLQSLKSSGKNISVDYDSEISPSLLKSCNRIVAIGFANEKTGIHAHFIFNKITYFKETYILLTEDLLTIDKDAVKKKQFWKLLQE